MRRLGNRMIRPMCATVACALFGLAAAAPAGAFLRDFETFQSQTSVSSDAVRTLLTGCPAGRVILGTGASAVPAASGLDISGVGLYRMWPAPAGGTSALLSAVEADPVAASWGLFAQRHCATPTATAPTEATNGAYIKDVFVASSATPFNSTSPKAVSTACQGGRQSIGGGFYVQNLSGGALRLGKVAVRRAVRVAGGFAVEAHETAPISASWNVTALAVCANLGNVGARQATYAGTISGNTQASPVNSSNKSVSVGCPPGHFALGGGAEVLGHTPTTLPPGDVVLVGSFPGGRTSWIAYAVEETATNANWHVVARVICASPVAT